MVRNIKDKAMSKNGTCTFDDSFKKNPERSHNQNGIIPTITSIIYFIVVIH